MWHSGDSPHLHLAKHFMMLCHHAPVLVLLRLSHQNWYNLCQLTQLCENTVLKGRDNNNTVMDIILM